MFVAYYFSEDIFNFVRKPIEPFLPQHGLVFTGVTDKFVAHIKLSVVAGFSVASPFIFYQAWKFIEPGLYQKEKKYAGLFISSGTLLFWVGFLFAYYVVFPMAFQFLMNFGGPTDKPLITISDYLQFFIFSAFVFGLVFELPLLLVILALMGIIDASFLKKNRRYAYVIMSIVAAVITPPDALSMMLIWVPMILLYEIALFIISRMAPAVDPAKT